MPPVGGGHDSGLAGHRLQVHDAHRLVDGRADEHGRVGEDLDHLGAGQHLRDPDDARRARAEPATSSVDLGGDLRGVGRARAEHQLGVGVEVAGGAEQVDQALLPGDPADEDDVRPPGSMPCLSRRRCPGRAVSPVSMPLWITETFSGGFRDSVASTSRRIPSETAMIASALARAPARPMMTVCSRRPVARPSTAAAARGSAWSPRAACRTASWRRDLRNWRTRCGECTRSAPSHAGRHLQIDSENLERGVGRFQPAGHPVGLDAMLGSRRPEAADPGVGQPAQLAGEIFDVHSRPSVDVRGVLTGEQIHAHGDRRLVFQSCSSG